MAGPFRAGAFLLWLVPWAGAAPLPLDPAAATNLPPGLAFHGRTLDAAALPSGRLRIAGVDFEVDPSRQAVITAADTKVAPLAAFPAPLTASRLVFLHTFHPGRGIEDLRHATGLAHRKIQLPPPPPVVMAYEITYADGRKIGVDVRFGESIEQWYRVHTVAPMLWAREAWTKDLDPLSGEKCAVYAMSWPNPRPEAPVAAIAVRGPEEPWREWGTALVLGVAAVEEPAPGRNLFVHYPPLGSDEGRGALDDPFASLERAVREAAPGDTIYVRGGLYALQRPVFLPRGGETNRWLTISAYPGETPVFEAQAVREGKPLNPAIQLPPKTAFDHDNGAIQAENASFLRIQGLHIRNSPRAAISARGRSGSERGRFVEIAFNTVERAFSMGIIPHCIDDLKIIGNRLCRPHSALVLDASDTLDPFALGEHPQESIDLSRNDRFEIAFNEVYGSNKEAIDLISVRDGRVHHNLVHSSLSGIYIDSWTLPIERVEVDHNFIDNAYGGIPCSTEGSNNLLDFRIHHNIIVHSKMSGISLSEAVWKSKPAQVSGHRVYHNTVDAGGGHAIGIGWFSTGIGVGGHARNPRFRDLAFFNNIVTRDAGLPYATSVTNLAGQAILFSHNLAFPAEDRTPAWMRERDPKGSERHQLVIGDKTVAQDPMFRDPDRGDYRLREGSPALGAGVRPGPDGDFDPRGKAADLGALPREAAWLPGFDWAGRVTRLCFGARRYTPVEIPRALCTLHRNHLQRPSWYQIGRYGVDFQRLPSGEQSFAGVTWWIPEDGENSQPTVLALRGVGCEAQADAIRGIPVGRMAGSLCFLHAYHTGPVLREKERANEAAGTKLFEYVVRYAGGGTAEIPVVWGEHIGHWLVGAPRNLPGARVAWSIPYRNSRQKTPGMSGALALYAMEWTNPRPADAIEKIDIVAARDFLHGSPAVFAISTGE